MNETKLYYQRELFLLAMHDITTARGRGWWDGVLRCRRRRRRPQLSQGPRRRRRTTSREKPVRCVRVFWGRFFDCEMGPLFFEAPNGDDILIQLRRPRCPGSSFSSPASFVTTLQPHTHTAPDPPRRRDDDETCLSSRGPRKPGVCCCFMPCPPLAFALLTLPPSPFTSIQAAEARHRKSAGVLLLVLPSSFAKLGLERASCRALWLAVVVWWGV